MKTKQTIIIILMIVAGVFFPLLGIIEWRPLLLAIGLDILPYILLPIAAYVGMKNGLSSKGALVLNVITCLSMIINILLWRFAPLWWAVPIPGLW